MGELCCTGECVPLAEGCGCPASPLEDRPPPCMAELGTGATCLTSTGVTCGRIWCPAVTPEEVRGGACGCDPAGTVPVSSMICPADAEGLLGFCATRFGQAPGCTAQNNPMRVGNMPAGNCGVLGQTCSVPLGGLSCRLGDNGIGYCGCSSDEDFGCITTATDADGGVHTITDERCQEPSNDTFICGCNQGPPCEATGVTPDCCGAGCTNVATDPNNCGTCGAACGGGDGVLASCGENGLAPGQCACTAAGIVAIGCPMDGTGGGPDCASGGCVCPAYNPLVTNGIPRSMPCPPGMYCCTRDVSQGCCTEPCGNTTTNTCITN